MKLVKPSVQYKDSFVDAAADIIAEGYSSFLKAGFEEHNFQQYCDKVNNLRLGIGLEGGKVSETCFWLIDDEEKFAGHTSIRHELSESLLQFGGHIGYIIAPRYRGRGYGMKILGLALVEASHMGLDKVLLTCDKTNIASATIIEENGGVFENEYYNEGRGAMIRRYWIGIYP